MIFGIADDRQAGAAEVAAEADAQAARQGEVRHGRAQDVAGVEKLGRHAVQGAERAMVVAGDEMPQGLDGLLGAVERLIGGQLPFGVLGRLFLDDLVILLLDMGAVQQDDLGDVAAGGGGVDIAAEPVLDQDRQGARMVEMSVGEDERLHRRGVEGQLAVLLVGLVAPALEHAAVHLQHPAVDVEKMLGPGDFPAGAVRVKFNGHPYLYNFQAKIASLAQLQ